MAGQAGAGALNADLEQHIRKTLLRLLADGPDYGLGLKDRLAAEGTVIGYDIYPILRQMERDGLLVSIERPVDPAVRGGRPRIYYKLPEKT